MCERDKQLEGCATADGLCEAEAPDAGPALCFRDEHLDFQHLARELCYLVRRNRSIVDGVDHGPASVFSVLVLTFVALERFLRMVLAERAAAQATLPTLLAQATGRRLSLFAIEDRDETIRTINTLRLGIHHGLLGADHESEHRLHRLLSLSFDLYAFTNDLVAVFDPATGQPRPDQSLRFAPEWAPLANPIGVLTPDADLCALREHNLAFGPDDPQDQLLMLAEGALCLVLVEAIGRRALGPAGEACEGGFRGVLELAAFGEPKVLTIPFDDEADGIERMCAVRNSLLHGNYDQAAREAGCDDVPHYFRTQFAGEIEGMFRVYCSVREQLQRAEARPR